ncbi:serine/threonine-protein kinase [Saccharothrix syringae]|uniref:non-specific serine/threonine protein kinase n=1 Tax=Saccharothrix syringae TaxID=103733 RepID=A0A5Q0H1C7_SACSY|nr:serine/threonine-protein kinase [Saccharothrix syringae]QFZ19715.1 serine/threonine protein kinase [Saccharothrix syringae]
MTEVGSLVAGRYRVRERLGGGAMGVVWQASDERLGRVVALKQLVVPPGADLAEAVRRAEREGRIAARLQHPNAVTVHDVVEQDGRPVLVMEYVRARSLAESGRLAPERAARVGAQVAGALAAAHAAGIVHRDVKPGNVLITAEGTAKITDFGIARAVGDVAVTRTGLLAGTPAFLSPEVARGGEPGPASDVFSLGATLYAVVEGRPPFGDGDNPIALLHTVAAGRFPPPAHAGPLTGLLLDMLRTDPATRPTMAQVADRLAAPAVHAPPPATHAVPGPAPLAATRAVPRPTAALPVPRSAPPAGIRRPRVAVPVAVAVVGAAALALVLTDGDSTPSATNPSSTSAAPSSTTTAGVDPQVLTRAVADYYALLPEHADRAWARLGPGLRGQDRKRYERFWHEVEDLTVDGPPQAAGPDSVTVGITYTVPDRGRFTETHRLGLLVDGDSVLIDSDEVLSSRQVDDGKKDKKGEGEKKGRG